MSDKERMNRINSYLDRIHDSRVKKCSKNNRQTREEFMNKLHTDNKQTIAQNENFNTRPERQLESEKYKQNIMARYLAREKMLQRYLSRT